MTPARACRLVATTCITAALTAQLPPPTEEAEGAFDLVTTLPHVAANEEPAAEKTVSDSGRWSNWTNWPTIGMTLVALLATGSALLAWNI